MDRALRNPGQIDAGEGCVLVLPAEEFPEGGSNRSCGKKLRMRDRHSASRLTRALLVG